MSAYSQLIPAKYPQIITFFQCVDKIVNGGGNAFNVAHPPIDLDADKRAHDQNHKRRQKAIMLEANFTFLQIFEN